jgi:hypothetical protein
MVAYLRFTRRYQNGCGVCKTLHANGFASHQVISEIIDGEEQFYGDRYWVLLRGVRCTLDDELFLPEVGDELFWLGEDQQEQIISVETLTRDGEDIFVRFETDLILPGF